MEQVNIEKEITAPEARKMITMVYNNVATCMEIVSDLENYLVEDVYYFDDMHQSLFLLKQYLRDVQAEAELCLNTLKEWEGG